MRRRLLVSSVVFVVVLLAIFELPLALVYSHHEHETLTVALQRDAGTVAGVIQEILEHPGEHDLDAFTAQLQARSGDRVVVVGAPGRPRPVAVAPSMQLLVAPGTEAASRGAAVTGEVSDLLYVAVPVGSRDQALGAVVLARSDADVDARVHRFWLALLALAAVVIAVVAVVSDRLAQWIIGPLRSLGERARDIGEGDLHLRAETRGPSEVVELAQRFNEMADRLDVLITSQRRFVTDASHQLRTPLTALRLRLENLDVAEPGAPALDAALAEVARLSRLVDGLLVLARAERRDQPREPVDVGAVVRDRQQAWAPLAAEHGVELRRGPLETTASASLAPGALEQILDNLIANALEATPSGRGVECNVAMAKGAIEVHVTDEGHGLSDEERERAFDPFWQGRNSTGSSGLGLAIVEQLARSNGATVALLPSPSGGVDAVVRLPAIDRVAGAAARLDQAAVLS